MANVDLTQALTGATHQTKHGNVVLPYRTEVSIDLKKVSSKKGSAVAAGDVVQAIRLPANTAIMWAGVTKTGDTNASALTVSVGTSDDNDKFASGFDVVAAKKNENSGVTGTYSPTVVNAETTVDLTIATLTGDNATGKVSVWALLLDLSPVAVAGLAKVGS